MTLIELLEACQDGSYWNNGNGMPNGMYNVRDRLVNILNGSLSHDSITEYAAHAGSEYQNTALIGYRDRKTGQLSNEPPRMINNTHVYDILDTYQDENDCVAEITIQLT